MRILQISHGIYPYVNAGVEIYTYRLSRELMRRRHEVLVAAPIPSNTHDKIQSNVLDVPLQPVPYLRKRFFGAEPNEKDRKRAWSSLQRIIKEFQPEIIHVQHLIHMGWHTLIKIQNLGIPYIVSIPDYWFLCPGIQRMCVGSKLACTKYCVGAWPGQGFRFLLEYYRIRHRLHQCVDLLNRIPAPLVPVSYRAAEIFKQSGVADGRLVVQPWGVDTPSFKNSVVREITDKVKFAYFGTVFNAKGVEILVRAFKRLRSGAELHIYGGGSFDFISKLQDLSLGDSVFFHSSYDHQDLLHILPNVDVVVVPSIWEEIYNLVTQESLAARKIVIASATGGLKDRIFHGVNGFLFPPADVDALAQLMQLVAEKYSELSHQMKFELFQQDIRIDGERFEHLYRWTKERWDGLSKRTVEPIEWEWEEIADMLSDFLHEEKAGVVAKLKKEWKSPGITVAEAWKKKRPKTDEEILDFYRTTDSYLYDLLMVHRTPERRGWQKAAIWLLVKYKIHNLLDYGGGCGDDALLFTRAGFKCTLYDCGHLTAGFAKYSARHLGLDLEVLEDIPFNRQFDAIFCTELLEHVSDPSGEVEKMSQLLVPDGTLILTHSFDLVGKSYPSHLAKHKGLSAGFVKEVESRGFICEEVYLVPGNRFFVFRQDTKQRQDVQYQTVENVQKSMP